MGVAVLSTRDRPLTISWCDGAPGGGSGAAEGEVAALSIRGRPVMFSRVLEGKKIK